MKNGASPFLSVQFSVSNWGFVFKLCVHPLLSLLRAFISFMDSSLFQCLLTFLFFQRKLDGLHGNVKLSDEIQIHFNLAGALAVLVLHGFMDDDFFHELTQHFIGIFRAVAVALNKRHKPFNLIFAGLNFIQLTLFIQNRFFKLCLFAFILGRQRIEPFLRVFSSA